MARQIQAHRGAMPDFRIDPHLSAGLPHESIDHRQAEAGALTDRLGGKKGSNARAITSGVMPVPVSVTQSDRYWPGGRSRSLAARSSSHLLAVSIVIRPPSG